MATFSALSTIFWTMRSTLSNSGHISVHVPTGVIALSKLVFFSGSARNPSLMAFARSASRLVLSYTVEGRSQGSAICAAVSRPRGRKDIHAETLNSYDSYSPFGSKEWQIRMEVNSVARFGRMVYLVGDGLSLELVSCQ